MPVGSPLDERFFRQIDRMRIVEGRRANPDATDEITLSEGWAQRLGVDVGGTFDLLTWTPAQGRMVAEEAEKTGNFVIPEPRGPRVALRVVGIERGTLDFAEDLTGRPLVLTPAFERAYGADVSGFGSVIVRVRLHGGPEALGAFTERLDRSIDIDPTLFELEEPRDTLRVVAVALLVVACVAAAASLATTSILAARWLGEPFVNPHTAQAIGLVRSERLVASVLSVGAGVAFGRPARRRARDRAVDMVPDRARRPR
jgi:hypothetical protein